MFSPCVRYNPTGESTNRDNTALPFFELITNDVPYSYFRAMRTRVDTRIAMKLKFPSGIFGGNADGDPDGLRAGMQYAGMGMQLAAAVVGFGLIGYWIDTSNKTGERYTTIFLFLGAIGGLYNFIKTALALGKKKNGDTGRPGADSAKNKK